uniref:tyrosine-protein kinase ZAP-70-like isoform X1 n=2 Tax=Myxine glutinosa TaxID=7769 RepID=UPI00358E323E
MFVATHNGPQFVCGQAPPGDGPMGQRGTYAIQLKMDLKKLTYFYGCITREEAEQYLTNSGLDDGLYLLRESRSNLGGYTLSVVCNRRFYHYHIAHQSNGGYAMDNGPLFSSPVKLCHFHHLNGDGMCCALIIPCSRPPGVLARASFFDSRKEKNIRDHVARTHKLQGMELEGYVVQHRSRLEREVAETLHRSMSWFHGVIARREAERRLLEGSKPISDGKFLIRERAESFAISVTHKKKVCHYMVERNSAGKLFVSEGIIFDTLWQMVEHYKSKPDGLLTSLKEVCPAPEPAYCSPEPPSLYIEEDLLVLDHENELGKGNFGSVVRGILKRPTNDIMVAVKMLKQGDEVDAMKADILKEAMIMQKLQHRHIVLLYGVCPGDPFMLVLELAPCGPLNKYLLFHGVKITVPEITELMYQVALGMEYLEEKSVVHRDLAARNVLLTDKNTAKISDFGLSRAVDSDCYQTSKAGKWPLKWYAPESIEYYKFTSRSDVWSFGVTLWEAFSYGNKPYSDKRGKDVLKFLKDGHRLLAPPASPSFLCDLMARCWLTCPSDRPSFKTIKDEFTSYMKK